MRARFLALGGRSLLALLALAPALRAQGELWTVGPPGLADFDTIQLAVNVAADGDFIFVEAGAYPSFVVDDKALTVVASTSVVTCGTIRVRNLAAGKACTFRGLRATGLSGAGDPQSSGAFVIGCEGSVWFEDCDLRARELHGLLDVGAPGLELVDSAQVVLAGGTVTGGTADVEDGHGIRASSARFALFGVHVQGGQFGNDCPGSDGGDGVHLVASCELFASGGEILGGEGTTIDCDSCAGDGGNGITRTSSSTVWLSDVVVERGDGGTQQTCLPCCDGLPGITFAGGPPIQFGQPARSVTTPRLLHAGSQDQLGFEGVAGDAAFLLVSSKTDFQLVLPWSGVSALYKPAAPKDFVEATPGAGIPVDFGSRFLGHLPASGELSVPLVALQPANEAAAVFVQAYAVDAGGTAVIGRPSQLIVLRDDLPVPDCNGNGIADPQDIAGGTSADCNANGVPDECDLFPDCNENGIDDGCDLAAGTSGDCDADGVPDECGGDCDRDGLLDVCEIHVDPSLDCGGNGSLDACEFRDCNGNGVHDDCDVANGISADLDGSGTPDECEARLFVRQDAPDGGDGLSWAGAFADLQEALAHAAGAPGVVLEIWVAEGTYTPAPPGSARSSHFSIPPDVVLYGGFAGTEDLIEDRLLGAHPTILSGDLDGDDTPAFGNRDDNAYQVVRGSQEGVHLDGLTVRGGNANGGTALTGGGVEGRAWLVRCRITDNFSIYDGAGVNRLVRAANCVFDNNWSNSSGGGVCGAPGNVELWNCVFLDNTAAYGGGFANERGIVGVNQIVNCTFVGNTATVLGGGVFMQNVSTAPTWLRNCILWGNQATSGTLEAQQAWPVTTASGQCHRCCIEGYSALPGAGHTGADPLFADPLGPDGTAGTFDDDLRLAPGSPCLDAGRNASIPDDVFDLDHDGNIDERTPLDLRDRPRRVDDPAAPDAGEGIAPLIDLGAYERQAP